MNDPALSVRNDHQAQSTPAPAGMLKAGEALLGSRLFLFWSLLVILLLQIYNNGYVCFRIDHTSQVPLIYMKHDPSLYARDWFLKGYGHFELRYYHLLLMRTFAVPFGLPGGILVLYLAAILMTMGAWIRIAKTLYGSPLPGLVMGLMATYMYGNEIGTNHLLEKCMIPRTEAYPFAYWGLYFLLVGRALPAGLLLALAGYFQPAVGILFFLPMMVWLLAGGAPNKGKQALWMTAGFVLPYLVHLFSLRHGYSAAGGLSSEEEIRIGAYIRHPHHMVPHLWGTRWLELGALAVLAWEVWKHRLSEWPRARDFGRLAFAIIGLLLFCTLFIEIFPVKYIVFLQPYRMAVMLYFVLLMVAAPHVMRLLTSGDVTGVMRGIMLIVALHSRWFGSSVIALEIVMLVRERRGRPLAKAAYWTVMVAVMGLILAIKIKAKQGTADDTYANMREYVKQVAWMAPLALAVILGIRQGRLFERPRLVHGVVAAAAVAGVVWMLSFFWMPYERRMENPKTRHPEKIAMRCWKYQFRPFPIQALERVGAWAEKNTPKDALFIIPPQPQQEGFHIWSKRAAVFCFKYIPLKAAGLVEWRERFLATRGITNPDSPEAQKEIDDAMEDYGGMELSARYAELTGAQMLALARRYGADYVISKKQYTEPEFSFVFSDYSRVKKKKNAKPLYVYKLDLAKTAAGDAPTTGTLKPS